MASPSDWAHFYPSTAAESTVVSTGHGPGPAQPVHNIEGRVGKPSARRRTRASRRAPTTLLNTDPTNFRAMVQQFTGAPAGPYTNPTGPVISFGPQNHHHHQAPEVSLGQFGPYRTAHHHQQYDGPVIVQGGNVTDGFAQGGFNSSVASNVSSMTSTTNSGGFFFDGMMGGNNRNNGGYFL